MGSSPSDDDTGTLIKHGSPKSRSPFLGPLNRRMPDGWRFGVTVGAALSLCTLITNIVVLGVASAIASRNGHHSNIATIRTGPCSDIDHIQFGIHLAINAISTLLLGASNYCMQCLSAPTREDIDRAHGQGKWLDIGVPSMKNFSHIKSMKLLFWCLLALSSVPLHLLYNPLSRTRGVPADWFQLQLNLFCLYSQ